MKLTEELLSHLLGSLYDAAASPELWPPFLSRLEKIAGAEQAALLLHDAKFTDHAIAAQVDMAPDYRQKYVDHYAKADIWYQRARQIIYSGWVGTSQCLCSDKDLEKTEFYSDFLRPYGMFNQIGAVLEHRNDRTFVITLLRSRKAGAFGGRQLRLLKFLVPHLRRAFELHRTMTDLRHRGLAMQWALDSWSTGVILLDSTGRVLLLNRAAAQLIEQRAGLLLGPAGLEATHPSEARRLGELVRAALRTTNGNGFHPAGAMHIHRARSDRPLTLLVSPFRGQGMPIFLSRPAVAVFIADPDQQGQAREQVMQELYGLTPAETELALLLAAGKSLKEAAAERSVSLETARSQLKTLFSKTNTRRQSELVRLVLLLPGEPNP